jgi:hypothetical protein
MKKSSIAFLTAAALLTIATGAFAQNGSSSATGGGTPNGRPFRTLAGQVATLQGQVLDMSTQLTAIEQQVTASLGTIQSSLDALSAAVAANTASIDDLRTYASLQDQKIASLGGAILALESTMAGVQADMQAVQLHDSLMEQWLGTLQQQWQDAEARLAENSADIQRLIDADRALQEYAAALKMQLDFVHAMALDTEAVAGTLETRLATVQAQLSSKQDRIRTACAAGSSIRQVDAAGNVTCEFDDTGSGGAAGRLATADTWTSAVSVGANSFNYAYAYCPTGYLSLGGGFSIPLSTQVFYNAPFLSYGWVIGVSNPFSTPTTFNASVRCALITN